MCVIFGADITNGHSVSVQMDGERDILTFKGYSNIYIQHVSKSAASTELTGQIKGVGEIPIPLLHCISVSLKYYGYSMISPIGRAISDVGLTNLPFWESGRIPQILGRTEHNFVLSEYN